LAATLPYAISRNAVFGLSSMFPVIGLFELHFCNVLVGGSTAQSRLVLNAFLGV